MTQFDLNSYILQISFFLIIYYIKFNFTIFCPFGTILFVSTYKTNLKGVLTMRFWIKLPLYTKIFIGEVIGIILGFILQDNASFFEPIGALFIKLLQIVIVPLVV